MASAQQSHRICPACGSQSVRRSPSQGLEFLLRFLFIAFYRCRKCQHRYRAFRAPGADQFRFVWYLLAIFLFLVCFWFLLGYLSTPRPAE